MCLLQGTGSPQTARNLDDSKILAIATAAPASMKALAKVPGVGAQCVKAYGKAILSGITEVVRTLSADPDFAQADLEESDLIQTMHEAATVTGTDLGTWRCGGR